MAGLEVEDAVPAAPRSAASRASSRSRRIRTPTSCASAVDDGSGALLQIVCGASNAAAGLTVPLAAAPSCPAA